MPTSSLPLPGPNGSPDNDFELSPLSAPSQWQEYAQSRLVLTGGAGSPPEEVKALITLAADLQKPLSLLYLPWAGGETSPNIKQEFLDDFLHWSESNVTITIAPSRAALLGTRNNWGDGLFEQLTDEEKERVREHDRLVESQGRGYSDGQASQIRQGVNFEGVVREQLASHTIVYGGPGQQSRIMEVVREMKFGATIRDGVVAGEIIYAGTSAGTAAAAGNMFCGDRIEPGLGLVPPWVAIDQHLDRGNRMIRFLEGVKNDAFQLGVGLYERTTAVIAGGTLEVVAGEMVVIATKHNNKKLTLTFATPGERVPLEGWFLG